MSAVPMPQTHNYSQNHDESQFQENDWLRIGGGVTLIAGSLLLMTKQRRLGLLLTAAGATLAALENREALAEWWEALPSHLEKAQHMINQAQETMEDLSRKRDSIKALFGK